MNNEFAREAYLLVTDYVIHRDTSLGFMERELLTDKIIPYTENKVNQKTKKEREICLKFSVSLSESKY